MDNGNRIYRYCEVKLPGSEKLHPYRSDRFELSVGDVVTVPVGATNDPVTGTVVSVRCCLQSDSPCPPGEERQVIRPGPAVMPAVTDPLPSPPQAEQKPAPPDPSVAPGRQVPASCSKPQRHPFLFGLLLGLLIYLFAGSCQAMLNDGKPAGTPKYTPRSSYTPRSTPRPTPRPTPTPTKHPVPSYHVGTVGPTGDPYHADDYVHPDDFYYEYWDDFTDYEDAEDYWDEHH